MPASNDGTAPRHFSFWLARHYPGWVSRHTASEADPIALAREIERLAGEFLNWLDLPQEQRWDTFQLQSLSAALFNRYQLRMSLYETSPVEVELIELRWPAESEGIVWHLKRLQTLLQAPFAILKAVRQASLPEECPTSQELALAHAALQAARGDLKRILAGLRAALAAALVAGAPHTVSA